MIGGLNPGLILIAGVVLLPLFQGRMRNLYLLALPLLSLTQLLMIPMGTETAAAFMGMELAPLRLDRLSFIFALIFHAAAFLSLLYALHLKDRDQHAATLIYAGAAIAAVLSGDLLSLLLYWEASTLASAYLIWAGRTAAARSATLRYLGVQIGSGLFLLAGVAMHYRAGGSLAFAEIGIDAPGGLLILLAIGVKSAFPLLHNWLTDAYPHSTPTGAVALSAFTTKLGIYALARGFPGTEYLIWIGGAMAVFPIFFAVIENDLRRVLGYSMINQLGFMVVGVGIGTELALNGTAAHAFADIIFKGLLFMSMGAVLLRAGTVNGSQLGGLYKSMPWTTGFCIVGAASISAFPLFSAFVTKSMILSAVQEEGLQILWLLLLFASAGVFHHAGIKIPYFAFFAHDSGLRCKEAPINMLIAMGIAAFLCVVIGVWPEPLYAILPFEMNYAPYTASHVTTQIQLLFFSAMAFVWLNRAGIYPPELRSVNLDSDWFFRVPGYRMAHGLIDGLEAMRQRVVGGFSSDSGHVLNSLLAPGGVMQRLSKPWSAGVMSLIALVFLLAGLLLF